MDRHLNSLSSSRDKRYDRHRRQYNGSVPKKGGQYPYNDRRSKHVHRHNRSNNQNVLSDISNLLKEIITSQQKTLKLLDKNKEMDNRIASALELIAAKTC